MRKFLRQKNCGGVHRHRVRHCRVPNGCTQPVLRVERSHGGGYIAGGAGINAASSAQLKCAGGCETACLETSWGELGHTGGDGGIDSEQGVSLGADSIVGGVAGV